MSTLYLDTSALAKWYLNERRSEEFEEFISREPSADVSRLTVLEFRCLLSRRRRTHDIDGRLESRIIAEFEKDVRDGHLFVHPLTDTHASAAVEILTRFPAHTLRTLDALHLAIARSIKASRIATADRILAEVAARMDFQVIRFD